MFVWSFKEIIALLLCLGVAITVLLIIINESFVYVHSTTDLRYRRHQNWSVWISLLSLSLNIKLSVIRTLSNPNFSSGPTAIRNRPIILYPLLCDTAQFLRNADRQDTFIPGNIRCGITVCSTKYRHRRPSYLCIIRYVTAWQGVRYNRGHWNTRQHDIIWHNDRVYSRGLQLSVYNLVCHCQAGGPLLQGVLKHKSTWHYMPFGVACITDDTNLEAIHFISTRQNKFHRKTHDKIMDQQYQTSHPKSY